MKTNRTKIWFSSTISFINDQFYKYTSNRGEDDSNWRRVSQNHSSSIDEEESEEEEEIQTNGNPEPDQASDQYSIPPIDKRLSKDTPGSFLSNLVNQSLIIGDPFKLSHQQQNNNINQNYNYTTSANHPPNDLTRSKYPLVSATFDTSSLGNNNNNNNNHYNNNNNTKNPNSNNNRSNTVGTRPALNHPGNNFQHHPISPMMTNNTTTNTTTTTTTLSSSSYNSLRRSQDSLRRSSGNVSTLTIPSSSTTAIQNNNNNNYNIITLTLDGLPEEVKIYLLEFLDIPSIGITVALLNKPWKDITEKRYLCKI